MTHFSKTPEYNTKQTMHIKWNLIFLLRYLLQDVCGVIATFSIFKSAIVRCDRAAERTDFI